VQAWPRADAWKRWSSGGSYDITLINGELRGNIPDHAVASLSGKTYAEIVTRYDE
jgi:hypothetical protein